MQKSLKSRKGIIREWAANSLLCIIILLGMDVVLANQSGQSDIASNAQVFVTAIPTVLAPQTSSASAPSVTTTVLAARTAPPPSASEQTSPTTQTSVSSEMAYLQSLTYKQQSPIDYIPLEKAYYDLNAVSQWVMGFVMQAYNLNNQNFKSVFVKMAEEYLSLVGWNSFFLDLFSMERNMNSLLNTDWQMSARFNGNIQATETYAVEGRFAWRIVIPLQIDYRVGNKIERRNVSLRLLVSRVSSMINKHGIAILKIESIE